MTDRENGRCASGRDDVELYGRGDLGVQPDGDGVRAHRFDRVAHLDPALVDCRTAGVLDSGDDVRRRHRAEQPPGLARSDLEGYRSSLQPGLDVVGSVQVPDLADRPGAPDRVELLLATASPPDC